MKVFLSSTYNDLIEHRQAAHDALAQLGLHVIWMEAFGARPVESTQACLHEVEDSELFVGIYAHRYGYTPTGSSISITEQEFDHAQKLGKPIFGFIINEEHPWSPKNIEHDKKDKLSALLGKVKKQPVEFFTTPDNLAQNIASSVGHYLAKHKPLAEFPSPTGRGARGEGSNTLPKQEFFFGRAEELKTIAAALSPETRAWGALIDGPGGIGKTSLAIRAAHLAPEALFARKIFITAKVRELTPEGEKKLTDFTRPTYLAMLEELGKELGEEGLEKLVPEARPNTLRLALAGKKALIIFDNLETLPEDERVRLFQFLSRLPEGNKAIVTSRRRSDVDARIVRLDRLAHDEAMQLLTELAAKYPRLARATQKERDDLYSFTQGNPLFMRWIAGQLGRTGSQCRTIAEACAFISQVPKGNDPLEYIFGDLLETFNENETKVLAALTYFIQPAKLQWLAQMTDLPEPAAETALEDLADRSVLTANLEARSFLLPPLAAQFIKTRRPEAVTQTGDALVDRAYALALQYGGNANYEGFRTLDAEWDLLAAALPRLLVGNNDRLQEICNRLFQFLNFTGRWDDLIWLNEHVEACALAADDKENAGRRAYTAGWTYYLRNQPAEVLACAIRAAEHWKNSNPFDEAAAIQLRGLGHRLKNDYPAAIDAHRETLVIFQSISPESDNVAMELNWLAGAEHLNKDYTAAERDYREALRIAKVIKDDEGTAIYTGNLAALAIDRGQWAEAESLAREALALAEKVGRQELIAGDCYHIAKALLKQNRVGGAGAQHAAPLPNAPQQNAPRPNASPQHAPQPDLMGAKHASPLQEALSLARRAVEIFTRLRQQDNLQEAQETLAEIEQKMKAK